MAYTNPRQVQWPPPQPPPPPPVTVTITGKILYPKGPWGGQRPVRHRGSVLVWEGVLWDPTKPRRHLKKPTGKQEQVQLAHGAIVDLYDKKSVSGEVFTEADGSFRVTTRPIDPNTYNLVLGIRDYNYVSAPGSDVKECFYDLQGSVQLIYPQGSIQPTYYQGPQGLVGSIGTPQGVGTIRVPWWPPTFMTYLATANAVVFSDTQKLARRLGEIAANPTYPTTIKLHRESALSQMNQTGEDYTLAQGMLKKLVDGNLQPGFPDRLVQALQKVPRLAGARGSSTADVLAAMLERLVTVNIDELERKALLTPLLNGVNNALGESYNYSDPTDDPAQDMAAACTIITVAALMARGATKVDVKYGFQNLANSQKMLSVDVSVSK